LPDIVPEAVQSAAPEPSAASEQYKPADDDAEDKIRQLFQSESSEAEPAIDIGVDSTVDERDAPFDLPDYVLTPTLADIYFQQGQPKLALHIYERLALRDPNDDRLQAQMQLIKDALLQSGEPEGMDGAEPAAASVPPKPKKSPGTRKKKAAETKDDRRPLAGVRIKKKPAKKSPAKKRKTS
jgi:hypothetical protein